VDKSSGVGVLDKTVAVLASLERGPASLAVLVERSGLARPTAHRLAAALEFHGLVARDGAGRFVLGPRIGELSSASGVDRLLVVAGPILARLRDATGESAQLYRRRGEVRVCVAAAERESGLRDTVPVGSVLPMTAGSAAQVLLAFADPDEAERLIEQAVFPATALAQVRRRGWASSVAEREEGVASVSAPVRARDGSVLAAISVSGPIGRLSRTPGRLHAPAVMAAADALGRALADAGDVTSPD
jgi:DNA-binding IclR family transcriptional regulator